MQASKGRKLQGMRRYGANLSEVWQPAGKPWQLRRKVLLERQVGAENFHWDRELLLHWACSGLRVWRWQKVPGKLLPWPARAAASHLRVLQAADA